MNYEEFCKWVKNRLEEQFEEGAHIEIQSVRKNNGVRQEGLFIIREGSNITPTIYLREFYNIYEDGMEPEEVLKLLLAVYEANKAETNLDFSFFKDFKQVKDRIAYKLINKENNEALLTEVPWIPLLDLALVFYFILPEHFFTSGIILIKQSHCEEWGVDKKQLLAIAKENTPKLCPPMLLDMKVILDTWESLAGGELENNAEDFLKNFWKPISLDNLELSDRKREEYMFILTNDKRNLGAAAILYDGVLKKLSEKFQSDLYILPSSIHECIVLPADKDEAEELGALVSRVNHSQVAKEEWLSNCVYRYVKEKDEIV